MDDVRQRDGTADALPAWLHRPDFVPAAVMLAIDAMMEGLFGEGYSSFGVAHAPSYVWFVVSPVPGAIAPGADREALARETVVRCAELGLPGCRVTIKGDTPPAEAFRGLMAGTVFREGHKRLGIPRSYGPPVDIDTW